MTYYNFRTKPRWVINVEKQEVLLPGAHTKYLKNINPEHYDDFMEVRQCLRIYKPQWAPNRTFVCPECQCKWTASLHEDGRRVWSAIG